MKNVFKSTKSPVQVMLALKAHGLEEKELWKIRDIKIKISNFFYEIDGNTFKIIKPSNFRHILKPYFHGSVYPTKYGSRIEGEFNMPFFSKLFLGGWIISFIGMLIYIVKKAIPLILMNNQYTQNTLSLLPSFFFIIIFICTMLGIFYLSIRERKIDEMSIIEFIERSCHATHKRI